MSVIAIIASPDMPAPENPFSYGSPVRAEHFTDRREELADIVARMLGGQNVILLSPRRYGKTSLLFKAMEEVRRRKGRTGYVTLARCTDRREVAEAFFTGIVNGPLSWLRRRQRELVERLRERGGRPPGARRPPRPRRGTG